MFFFMLCMLCMCASCKSHECAATHGMHRCVVHTATYFIETLSSFREAGGGEKTQRGSRRPHMFFFFKPSFRRNRDTDDEQNMIKTSPLITYKPVSFFNPYKVGHFPPRW